MKDMSTSRAIIDFITNYKRLESPELLPSIFNKTNLFGAT